MQEEQQIEVFFDESGKRKDKPNLMGGLSIPSKIYSLPQIKMYSRKLRDGEIKLHWNEVSGPIHYRENVIKVLKTFAEFHNMIKANVIHYDYTLLANRSQFNSEMVEQTIYTKFPERIIYGLLRGYSKTVSISANIYIEKSSEYQKLELHNLIQKQLNIHSLYRGEHYTVVSSELVPKGKQIGVEVTDLMLGIIKTIMENKPSTQSKGYKVKNEVIIRLLKDENFYKLLSNVRFFEWNNTTELTEINFNDYIRLFIANHYDIWEQTQ